jgi:hypothetical protein
MNENNQKTVGTSISSFWLDISWTYQSGMKACSVSGALHG